MTYLTGKYETTRPVYPRAACTACGAQGKESHAKECPLAHPDWDDDEVYPYDPYDPPVVGRA